jgi:hypothetical protein
MQECDGPEKYQNASRKIPGYQMIQQYDEPGGNPEWLMQDARSEGATVCVQRHL